MLLPHAFLILCNKKDELSTTEVSNTTTINPNPIEKFHGTRHIKLTLKNFSNADLLRRLVSFSAVRYLLHVKFITGE